MVTGTTTKTLNKFGDETIVTTTSQYEQTSFRSKMDWRIRMIAANSLHLRTKQIYVSDAPEEEEEVLDEEEQALRNQRNWVLVLPKNVLKTFVSSCGDLKTKVGVFMYGSTPESAPQVREVKCLIIPPQRGSNIDVEFPNKLPEHSSLKNLEFLGILKTSFNEIAHLSPADVERSAKKYPFGMTITCTFTPGSILLTAFRLTPMGVDWGKESAPIDPRALTVPSFQESEFSRKCTMLLSEKIVGFFLSPSLNTEEGFWNYSFQGHRFLKDLDYQLGVGNPISFYDETHRSNHFLSFSDGPSNFEVGSHEILKKKMEIQEVNEEDIDPVDMVQY